MDEQLLETIELEIAILYRRITSMTTSAKAGKLERSAYLLLHHIRLSGSIGVKALAEEIQLDVSTVSRQTAALEHKGYVTRQPDPADGRAYFLRLTKLGEEEYLNYRQARLAHIRQLLENWSEDESQQFGQLLQKFNQSFI
ncbi:MarR family winged helix-turn-helix transcriptional regulator [Paenibacillus puldeungensis]|uniref:MarR family winged helix-turn-helix transcriptional regulator n=1 Tax=Paenibacillus puldeungensis TaxID=696536 RepID=A0ABW3RTB8_9BACL